MSSINTRTLSNRIGETTFNNFGSKMIIIKYNNRRDIDIYFPDTDYTSYNREYSDFVNGAVSSLYDKTVCGVGYLGVGKYKCYMNGKITSQYHCWGNMLNRCYDPKAQEKRPTYIGCSVYEEWLNFQVFSEWYDENYYEIEGQKMHLDKDILVKGNKIYSPETCVFAPIRINSFFAVNKTNNLLIGVSIMPSLKYRVSCNDENSIKVHLGVFKTIVEAFKVYKQYKENVIRLIADKYKDYIPTKLYDALYRYKIEITD